VFVALVVLTCAGAASTQAAGAAPRPRPAVAASRQSGGPTTTAAPSDAGSSTTKEDAGTAADDPAQDRLRLIIVGLVVLAAIVLVVTILFWRATSPDRVVTVSELPSDGVDEPSTDGADRIDVSDRAVAARVSAPAPADAAFAAALMSPRVPLPVDDAPTEAIPRPVPAVVRPDPVEWPDAEPDRLDLRQSVPSEVERASEVVVDEVVDGEVLDGEVVDDLETDLALPDPPLFESTAEQPALDQAPADWAEWQGIRPLGPVDRPADEV
jgi:hypothetical protein